MDRVVHRAPAALAGAAGGGGHGCHDVRHGRDGRAGARRVAEHLHRALELVGSNGGDASPARTSADRTAPIHLTDFSSVVRGRDEAHDGVDEALGELVVVVGVAGDGLAGLIVDGARVSDL